MLFYYLLLGHLLGDFTFQTDRIAENKNKDNKWIFIHTVIVTLSVLIFSLPFGALILFFVILNGVSHFYIDLLKSKMYIKSTLWAFIYFIIDQIAHVTIIYFISLIPFQVATDLPFDKNVITFLLSFIFILSFSTIFNQFVLNLIFSDGNKKFFMNNERSIGISIRITVFFALYLSIAISKIFLILILFIIALAIYAYNKRWSKWMSIDYFYIKLSLDLIMPFIFTYFLIK